MSNVPTINKTYVQTTQPTSGMNKGDTWIDTDDRNTLYTYNGSAWVKTQSGAKNYLQSTTPTSGMVDGDMWINTAITISSIDIMVLLGADYNARLIVIQQRLMEVRITTGSITAAQINVSDLFAQNIAFTGTITGGASGNGGIIKKL